MCGNCIPHGYSLKPQELTNTVSFPEEFVDTLARCSFVDPLVDLLVRTYIRKTSKGQTHRMELSFHLSLL